MKSKYISQPMRKLAKMGLSHEMAGVAVQANQNMPIGTMIPPTIIGGIRPSGMKVPSEAWQWWRK